MTTLDTLRQQLASLRQHLSYCEKRAAKPLPSLMDRTAYLFLSTPEDCANEAKLIREKIREYKEMEATWA